jgi:broad specificity polyphosphatase/5'/3'-nucleotidase SurE
MTKRILVTNDDGVLSPGLLALAQEMRKLGDVTISRPTATGLAADTSKH